MNNTDTRVQFTKEMLKRAVLQILQEKSIERVTVTEICARAGINRGTFYLHYSTPVDLLKEAENALVQEALDYLKSYDGDLVNTDMTMLIFESLKANMDDWKIITGPNGDPQLFRSLFRIVKEKMLQEWAKENPSFSRENLEFVYDFVFAGATAVIQNWLQGGCVEDAQIIARRVERLGHYSQLAAAEF